jgi:hypothetical protein
MARIKEGQYRKSSPWPIISAAALTSDARPRNRLSQSRRIHTESERRYVGEDFADIRMPLLHRLIKPEIFYRKVVEIGLQLQISCLPMLRVFYTFFRGAESSVGQPQWNDPAQEILFFANRSLIDGVQLGHAIGRAQVFVAEHYDHVIGKPDAFHETRNQIA